MTALLELGGVAERFWGYTAVEDGCWQWQGNLAAKGYGRLGVTHPDGARRWHYAHRISYEMHKGDIPEGMQIDHLCRNRGCVNPDHLEAVTQKMNVLRGVSFSARNAQKTHCAQGHEYTPENTYSRKGVNGRDCRKCTSLAQRRYRMRLGVAA